MHSGHLEKMKQNIRRKREVEKTKMEWKINVYCAFNTYTLLQSAPKQRFLVYMYIYIHNM